MANTHSVVRYRIQNWRAYNRALVNRGRLTVWFDDQAIAAWRNTAPAAGPGARQRAVGLSRGFIGERRDLATGALRYQRCGARRSDFLVRVDDDLIADAVFKW